jgi:thymidylate kinase
VIPTIFIVEGLDCTGKTTLARHMADRLRASYFHASGSKSLHLGMMAYHKSILEHALVTCNNGVSVVLDRHWPSEWCYGRILRSHVTERHYNFNSIVSVMEKIDPVYVHCKSEHSYQAQTKSLENHCGDRKYTEQEFSMIGAEYRTMFLAMRMAKRVKVVDYVLEDDGKNMDEWITNKLIPAIYYECEQRISAPPEGRDAQGSQLNS